MEKMLYCNNERQILPAFLPKRMVRLAAANDRLLCVSTAHQAPFHGLFFCVGQRLQVCGCCSCRHEERDSTDQRAEAETGEHRQDRSVAGVRSGLGGTARARPSLRCYKPGKSQFHMLAGIILDHVGHFTQHGLDICWMRPQNWD